MFDPNVDGMRSAEMEPPPVRMVAGALAHLARHMETGCPRAARIAALLLAKIASDDEADDHLRRHARELVDILDRGHDDPGVPWASLATGRQSSAHR